jgi:hypothetical protein
MDVGSGARRHHTVRCGASRVPRGGTAAQSSHEWHSTRKMAGRECPLVVKCYLWVDLMVPRPNTRDVHICERDTRPDHRHREERDPTALGRAPGPRPRLVRPSPGPARCALARLAVARARRPPDPRRESPRPRLYLIESPSLGASPSKGVPGGAVHRQQPCRSEEFPIRV